MGFIGKELGKRQLHINVSSLQTDQASQPLLQQQTAPTTEWDNSEHNRQVSDHLGYDGTKQATSIGGSLHAG